jgi:mono/diheme cytochrome c family protein
MRLSRFIPSLFVAGALACAALSGSAEHKSGQAAARPSSPAAPQANDQLAEEGQRVFQQNCSRCHNAPESFPPSITGTILRHMRVRANLSRHQERALLEFLNR